MLLKYFILPLTCLLAIAVSGNAAKKNNLIAFVEKRMYKRKIYCLS